MFKFDTVTTQKWNLNLNKLKNRSCKTQPVVTKKTFQMMKCRFQKNLLFHTKSFLNLWAAIFRLGHIWNKNIFCFSWKYYQLKHDSYTEFQRGQYSPYIYWSKMRRYRDTIENINLLSSFLNFWAALFILKIAFLWHRFIIVLGGNRTITTGHLLLVALFA